ncbi:MAG: protein kinase [Armatimonadetes bacterium]|nr:protein kinase [Armatimonadota bacterium]
MLLRPGDLLEGRLDTYAVSSTMSRGAYGCAHLARTSDGAWRVIKQFLPTEELSRSDLEYQRLCFDREADILTRFHSPLIVYGYELIHADDDRFLVMEHVQGQTLRALFDRHRLDNGQPWAWPRVVAIGRQLAAALHWLHGLPGRIIYRDLKPANIMWDAVAQRLKLIDFGTARFNADGSRATQGLGTAGYAPPELYGQGELGPPADVYTLGAVLYELLTGTPPPDRTTPTDFSAVVEPLPAELSAALTRALQQDPARRFADAGEFGAALGALAVNDDSPLTVPPRNLHPPIACFCPTCGREPGSDSAVFCGVDGSVYQVAMLRIVPRHRPATTVYLDRREAVLGRNDPDRGWYPEVDLSACDPARHVSRRHARLRRDAGSLSVVAAPTTNSTRVDGQPLAPDTPVELKAGSRLELGDLVATVIIRPVLDPTPVLEEGYL